LCWAVFLGVGMPNWESMTTREIVEWIARVGGPGRIPVEAREALRLELRARVEEGRARSKEEYRERFRSDPYLSRPRSRGGR
jgi:hypothetical protein